MTRRIWFVVPLMIVASCLIAPISRANPTAQEGKLIVRVLVGDDNSPARDAFVYVRGYFGPSPAAVSPTKAGWFEISLQPGLYDVFVGEGSSLPRCRRIEIKANYTRMYTAKLEADEDHLQN